MIAYWLLDGSDLGGSRDTVATACAHLTSNELVLMVLELGVCASPTPPAGQMTVESGLD